MASEISAFYVICVQEIRRKNLTNSLFFCNFAKHFIEIGIKPYKPVKAFV